MFSGRFTYVFRLVLPYIKLAFSAVGGRYAGYGSLGSQPWAAGMPAMGRWDVRCGPLVIALY